MTGRDVTAPNGARAWIEGSGPHPGRWVYDAGERATLRSLGAYVLDVRDGVVPGIIGTVAMPDFMALAGRLDALEAQLDVLTRGTLAIVADVDRRASGEPSLPPFAETS